MNSPYMVEQRVKEESAMCTKHDPDIWFPSRMETENIDVARALCGVCPINSQECLSFGKSTKSDGIWGGVLLNRGKVIAA